MIPLVGAGLRPVLYSVQILSPSLINHLSFSTSLHVPRIPRSNRRLVFHDFVEGLSSQPVLRGLSPNSAICPNALPDTIIPLTVTVIPQRGEENGFSREQKLSRISMSLQLANLRKFYLAKPDMLFISPSGHIFKFLQPVHNTRLCGTTKFFLNLCNG